MKLPQDPILAMLAPAGQALLARAGAAPVLPPECSRRDSVTPSSRGPHHGRFRTAAARRMTVRRRHVIYVPGYDPRGVAHYYRMFRHELGRFRTLHGLRTEVSRPTSPPDAAFSTWIVTTHGPGWQVETTYELMRWDDVVRADAGRPIWRRIGAAWLLLARYLFTGTLARIAWAHWRFGLFFLYPYITLLAIALAAALAGTAVAALFAGLLGASPPLALALLPTTIGAGLALAVMVAILRLSESRTYLLYLFDDGTSTDAYARRCRPDWEARLALFAERVVAVAQAAAADEIVVVGHSSGSFMAVDVLAQALARDPALGGHGPTVSLVTMGANLPLVGFNRAGGWFVERLAQVLAAPNLAWLDLQSRKDVMCFCPFNQAAGHGLAGPMLTTVRVRFRDGLLPQSYAAFRWQFFRVHFQYLMANERPAAWDYFMMICGPRSLAQVAASLRR